MTSTDIHPLLKIVFIQRVALFAATKPKKVLKFCYVTQDWRDTVVHYTLYNLLKPFFEIPFEHLKLYRQDLYKKAAILESPSEMHKYAEQHPPERFFSLDYRRLVKSTHPDDRDKFLDRPQYYMDLLTSDDHRYLEALLFRPLRRFFYFVLKNVSEENMDIVFATKDLMNFLLQGELAVTRHHFHYLVVQCVFHKQQWTFAQEMAANVKNPKLYEIFFSSDAPPSSAESGNTAAIRQLIDKQFDAKRDSKIEGKIIDDTRIYWHLFQGLGQSESDTWKVKTKCGALLSAAAASGNVELLKVLTDREHHANVMTGGSSEADQFTILHEGIVAAQSHNQCDALRFLLSVVKKRFDPVPFFSFHQFDWVGKKNATNPYNNGDIPLAQLLTPILNNKQESNNVLWWRAFFLVLSLRSSSQFRSQRRGRAYFPVAMNFLNQMMTTAVRKNQVEIVNILTNELQLFSPSQELFGFGDTWVDHTIDRFFDCAKSCNNNANLKIDINHLTILCDQELRTHLRGLAKHRPIGCHFGGTHRPFPGDGARACNAFNMSIEYGSYEVFRFFMDRWSRQIQNNNNITKSPEPLFLPHRRPSSSVSGCENRGFDNPLLFCTEVGKEKNPSPHIPKVKEQFKPSSTSFSNDWFQISFQMAKQIFLLAHSEEQNVKIRAFCLTLDQLLNDDRISAFDWCPLHGAAFRGRLDLAQLFVYFGAKTEIVVADPLNKTTWTPLTLINRGHHDRDPSWYPSDAKTPKMTNHGFSLHSKPPMLWKVRVFDMKIRKKNIKNGNDDDDDDDLNKDEIALIDSFHYEKTPRELLELRGVSYAFARNKSSGYYLKRSLPGRY